MKDGKEEVSLRELIFKIIEWNRFLLSKWIIIFLFTLIGGIIGYIYAYTSKPRYTAALSFVLSSGAKTPNGLMGLANQFGVDIGGSGGNDAFSGDNIITLMMSRRMVEKTLFRKPPGINTTLINIIIPVLKLDQKWKNKARLKDLFPFPDSCSQLIPVQDSLIGEIYTSVTKEYLQVSRPDKKQSIFEVTTTSNHEIFSVFLTKFLVEETTNFYIYTRTKSAKQTLDMLQHEADSLRRVLGNTISTTAVATDQIFNLNPAFQIKKSDIQEGQTDATVIGTAYGEVIKNLEIAKITLQKETPLFQIIDEPILPLKREKTGIFKAVLLGMFFFSALIASLLVVKKIYLKIFKAG